MNIKVEEEKEHNPYYLKVSKRFRTVKFIALAALLLYLLAMLATNRQSITYENLVYLAKDLDTDVDADDAYFSEVKYDESSKMSAAIYKGRLAVATTASFTLYNTTGAAERSYRISMENPKVIAGDKYVLVYDVGGTTYSVYTALIEAYSGQTQYTLQGGAISDDGSFALITRARENRYTVTVYDRNFREVSRIFKDKYVMDAALSSDGTRYAVVSCDVDGTKIISEIISGKVDSESVSYDSVGDSLPLDVSFFPDGSFAAVCERSVSFFKPSGEKICDRELTGYGITGVSFSESGVMTVESMNLVGSTSLIRVFSPSGTETYSGTVASKVSGCALGNSAAYIVYDGLLTELSFNGTTRSAACPLSVSSLVPYSDNVLVLSSNHAKSGFAAEEAPAADTAAD